MLTKKDVSHVARLAGLKLSEGEIEKYTKELSEVVGYVSELAEVDTSLVQPTSQTTGLENVYRNDEPKGENCLASWEALSGSEKVYNGYFEVPDILSERTEK